MIEKEVIEKRAQNPDLNAKFFFSILKFLCGIDQHCATAELLYKPLLGLKLFQGKSELEIDSPWKDSS